MTCFALLSPQVLQSLSEDTRYCPQQLRHSDRLYNGHKELVQKSAFPSSSWLTVGPASHMCLGSGTVHTRLQDVLAKALVYGKHMSRPPPASPEVRRSRSGSLLSPQPLTYPSDRIPSAISHTRTKSSMKVRIQRRLWPGKWSQVLW